VEQFHESLDDLARVHERPATRSRRRRPLSRAGWLRPG